MQVTVVPPEQPPEPTPMTVIGEQSTPTSTSRPLSTTPRSPSSFAMEGSLACKHMNMVSHQFRLVDTHISHRADGAAARGAAGRRAAAALDRSGDRKKGQSRENESAREDHCDLGDECEGECECSCFAGDELSVRPEACPRTVLVFYKC